MKVRPTHYADSSGNRILRQPQDDQVHSLRATGHIQARITSQTAQPSQLLGPNSGTTLVEVLVAFGLFSIMALGSLTALVQTRKMSEDNVAQATAAVIAQGIIEQVHLNPYTAVADTESSPNLELKFTGANTNNLASIQQYALPWAPDATTFTEIGARIDPADPASPILGVLLDLDYKVGSTVVRPGRYMKMRVNIRRTVHEGDDNVEIILTYSWQPPSRNNGAGHETYLTRELRTIRSQAPSY